MEPYLRIQDVSKTFQTGGASYAALAGVSLDIAWGEFVSLIGHSGCGKSTLLNLIAGLTRPTAGALTLAGEPIARPGPDRGLVFQHHALLPWLTVYGNVYEAVDAVFPRRAKAEKAGQVEEVLRLVGLWDHRHKRPAEISGGMKQRTAVARAFAVHPRVLLLDEPFGALDALTKSSLHDELLALWTSDSKSETVVLVTHDIDEAIFLSDRIVVMTNGPRARIGEVVPVDLPRPRDKRALIHHPEYAAIKDRLLYLLTQAFAHAA
ncbi:MAG TPA: ABC transporter ATP-binding protein [Dehalococcoidia bacterium]|nr:ABC transporter ATP-binding protein [Dehalococcoidia bacterium]